MIFFFLAKQSIATRFSDFKIAVGLETFCTQADKEFSPTKLWMKVFQ